jgi:hypothetical protein
MIFFKQFFLTTLKLVKYRTNKENNVQLEWVWRFKDVKQKQKNDHTTPTFPQNGRPDVLTLPSVIGKRLNMPGFEMWPFRDRVNEMFMPGDLFGVK